LILGLDDEVKKKHAVCADRDLPSVRLSLHPSISDQNF